MAVLGIVIQQPNDTVTHIGQCLDRRFTRARFARSTAHSTLPRLARAGRVRCSFRAPGRDRPRDRYEATPSGVEVFDSWMFELPGATPALREAMYGRIELSRPEDLARLIEMARQEEAVSDALYKEALVRLRGHAAASRQHPGDYARQVREVLLYVDPMHWSSRSERYGLIAERLEEISREIAGPRAGVGDG
jgi:DNA-binding PadR family transcriptional regulator